MGAKYTKGQARAIAKYMEDKHTIKVIVPKQKAEEYKRQAESEGKSLNRFIIDRIEGKE